MKLYHGTSAYKGRKILKEGLIPRGRKTGNWKNNKSHANCVYLTNVYPFYFAIQAANPERLNKPAEKDTDDPHICVIEIETDRLPASGYELVPDEDAIEQTGRHRGEHPPELMEEMTARYRDELGSHRGSKNWEQSSPSSCSP